MKRAYPRRLARSMAAIGALIAGMLAPVAAQAYTFKILHSFCARSDCTDGEIPSGLITDGSGNLYGTAVSGADSGSLIFELSPSADKKRWQYRVIQRFCTRSPACLHGSFPSSLIAAASGALYGTTTGGGAYGGGGGANDGGIIFKMIDVGGWSELVLHSFCSEANCEDGTFPNGPLVGDGKGNFFGTTGGGGAHGDFGTVYELTP